MAQLNQSTVIKSIDNIIEKQEEVVKVFSERIEEIVNIICKIYGAKNKKWGLTPYEGNNFEYLSNISEIIDEDQNLEVTIYSKNLKTQLKFDAIMDKYVLNLANSFPAKWLFLSDDDIEKEIIYAKDQYNNLNKKKEQERIENEKSKERILKAAQSKLSKDDYCTLEKIINKRSG